MLYYLLTFTIRYRDKIVEHIRPGISMNDWWAYIYFWRHGASLWHIFRCTPWVSRVSPRLYWHGFAGRLITLHVTPGLTSLKAPRHGRPRAMATAELLPSHELHFSATFRYLLSCRMFRFSDDILVALAFTYYATTGAAFAIFWY